MLQALVFTWLWLSFSSGKVVPPARINDLIVVFPGDKERVREGHALAREGFSHNLLIIGQTRKNYERMLEQWGDLPGVGLIENGKSRSTFEDVYIARKIIEENRFHSVMLVTSGYHMPRVLFLASIYFAGMDAEIDLRYYPVELAERTGEWRNYCNELIKFWGSAVEMLGYMVTDNLLLDLPLFSDVKKFLKQRLYLRGN